MWMTRLFLVFLFLGQNGLQHIARLGDMREVDFWRYGLGRARGNSAGVADGARPTLELRAYLLRLVRLQ
jgi:hypothetical protein